MFSFFNLIKCVYVCVFENMTEYFEIYTDVQPRDQNGTCCGCKEYRVNKYIDKLYDQTSQKTRNTNV